MIKQQRQRLSYGRRGINNKKVVLLLIVVLSVLLCALVMSFALAGASVGNTRAGSTIAFPSSGVAVSVIVPVYNVRPYVEKCLGSLLHQTLPGELLEFIFVDDASTDGSYEVIEQYAAQDKRVHLVRNKKNAGSGEARNLGMALARGEYVGFVDSDDTVDPLFYERLYRKAKAGGYDIVKGTSFSVNTSGAFESRYNQILSRRLARGRKIFEAFHYQHQTAIYRRAILEEHHHDIHFGNYSNAQDCMFLLSYGIHAKTIAIKNDAKYYYLVRDDSASHRMNERFFRGNVESMNDRLDFLEAHLQKGSYRSYLRTYRRVMIERRNLLASPSSSVTDRAVVSALYDGFNKVINRIDLLLPSPPSTRKS